MWSEPSHAEIYFVGAVLVWAFCILVAVAAWPRRYGPLDTVRELHDDWFGDDEPAAHVRPPADLFADRARLATAVRTGAPVSDLSGVPDRFTRVTTPVTPRR